MKQSTLSLQKVQKKSTFGNQDILLSIGMKICTNKRKKPTRFFFNSSFLFCELILNTF